MDSTTKTSLIASIVISLGLIFGFAILSPRLFFPQYIPILLVLCLIFVYFPTFLIVKAVLSRTGKDFPIQGWMWIFYIWGIISGALNVFFWIIMLILHEKDKDRSIINFPFYKRAFNWGVVSSIVTAILLVLDTFFSLGIY